jgi:hypothetical protein
MTTTEDTTTAGQILAMLERRERTAAMAYDEAADARDRMEEQFRYGDSFDGDRRLDRVSRELHRASSRWTEAQEALAEARALTR